VGAESTIVSASAELRDRYAAPNERARRKQLDLLDRYARRFISLSPFLVLASASSDGRVDASPRGGPPGFVTVADELTLLVPDWPGNNRLDSLTNIVEAPNVGLLFLIPGVDETLRVNGRAQVSADPELRARWDSEGRLPATVLVVTVEEVYLHCAKAFMRSRLWDVEAKVERSILPSLGEMIRDQIGSSEAESQDAMLKRYRATLY
jgi:uncharacterized protein